MRVKPGYKGPRDLMAGMTLGPESLVEKPIKLGRTGGNLKGGSKKLHSSAGFRSIAPPRHPTRRGGPSKPTQKPMAGKTKALAGKVRRPDHRQY